jgi:hypothetical protein
MLGFLSVLCSGLLFNNALSGAGPDAATAAVGRFWLVVRENLRRYTHGERVLNVVDIKPGY